MVALHSDALVFFSATGDPAQKKIFPALQAMVKRGRLDVPVIGVAKAGWDLRAVLDRFPALARSALLHPSRKVPARDVHRGDRQTPPAVDTTFLRLAGPELLPVPDQPRSVDRDRRHGHGLREGNGRGPVELLASHHPDGDEMGAYERLLGEAMKGDSALFAREDYVEAEWRIVDPVLGPPTPVHEYEPNTWGPSQADRIMADVGGWHDPSAAS